MARERGEPDPVTRYVAVGALILLLAGGLVPLGAGGQLCGDGVVQGDETCDPPEPESSAPDRCRSDCHFCGDGVLDAAFEACDDNDPGSAASCDGGCYRLTYVDLAGDDTTGDGSERNPYRSIQHAFDKAGAFYTIMVGPGTYSECVTDRTAAADGLAIKLIAQAWQDARDNTATVVSGNGICDATQTPETRAAVIEIRNRDSRVEGFTVTRGGASGIIGTGNVVITNNVITDNQSTVGGGVYLDLRATPSGVLRAEISDNRIIGNRVEFGLTPDGTASANNGIGGGVFVTANGALNDVEVLIDRNRIEGNTVNETSELDDVAVFGGGLGVFTSSSTATEIRVAVTRNVIAGNAVETGAAGYAGGAWAYTFGFGTETIDITGNTFAGNRSPLFGGGLSVWIDTAGTRGDADPLNDSDIRHTVNITGNSIFSNTSGNGGGLDLLLKAVDLRDAERAQINVVNNRLLGNIAFGGALAYSGGGGGALVTLTARRSATLDTGILLQDNTVQSNSAGYSGGGFGFVIEADSGALAPAVGRVEVVRNLITGNDASVPLAGGGGVFAFLEAHGDATATLVVDRSTIADNTSDIGAGGMHIETYTTTEAPQAPQGRAEVDIRNSIIAANDLVGVGGPIPGVESGIIAPDSDDNTGKLTLNVSYSDVHGHPGGNYDVWFADPTGADGNISADPAFGAGWRVGPCSRTIDAADPRLDFSLEPLPNGGRANMGHSGGTAQAANGLADLSGDNSIDGVDILRISVAFGATVGDPRYDAVADLNQDGFVDGSDLSRVAGNFGTSCSP